MPKKRGVAPKMVPLISARRHRTCTISLVVKFITIYSDSATRDTTSCILLCHDKEVTKKEWELRSGTSCDVHLPIGVREGTKLPSRGQGQKDIEQFRENISGYTEALHSVQNGEHRQNGSQHQLCEQHQPWLCKCSHPTICLWQVELRGRPSVGRSFTFCWSGISIPWVSQSAVWEITVAVYYCWENSISLKSAGLASWQCTSWVICAVRFSLGSSPYASLFSSASWCYFFPNVYRRTGGKWDVWSHLLWDTWKINQVKSQSQ